MIGFDINRKGIGDLRAGVDIAQDVELAELAQATLVYEIDPAALTAADFYIVTVLTPIDDARIPDLGVILSASAIVGAMLKRGDIVVYQATAYPGAIAEDCVRVWRRRRALVSRLFFPYCLQN